MKNLPKAKRNSLILVILTTVGLMAGVWFGLISFQKGNLKRLATDKISAQRKLADMKKMIDSAEGVEIELADARKDLTNVENGMASGDLLSWTINTLRRFKLAYKVEIPQFSQIDGPKDTTILADFPYKQATLTVAGSGAFHELGRFIADFENQFPYARVQNLSMEPSTQVSAEKEKLSFRMDIVVLVKPSAS
jgi:hypothetical protein